MCVYLYVSLYVSSTCLPRFFCVSCMFLVCFCVFCISKFLTFLDVSNTCRLRFFFFEFSLTFLARFFNVSFTLLINFFFVSCTVLCTFLCAFHCALFVLFFMCFFVRFFVCFFDVSSTFLLGCQDVRLFGRLVGCLVGWSVGRSVGRSAGHEFFVEFSFESTITREMRNTPS